MRYEGIDEVGGVQHQQHDRDAEAELFVDRGDSHSGNGHPLGQIEDCGQQYRDHYEEQHRRQQAHARPVEALPDPPDAADESRYAQKQQCRADDRTGDLRLDHLGLRVRED
jgi:hypothetical protein